MKSGLDTRREQFAFGTKAETLARVAPYLKLFAVPASRHFSVFEWCERADSLLQELQTQFQDGILIVRSSAKSEDSAAASLAGQFASVVNIPAGNSAELRKAVNTVIASYSRDGGEARPDDQILVQTMLADVLMSGVLFTQDLNTGAPYYVINYDDETGRTDTVTSGSEYANRTLVVHRGALDAVQSPRFGALLAATRELENVISGPDGHSTGLDIEFAVDRSLQVHLLQVRRMTAPITAGEGLTEEVDQAVARIRAFVRSRFARMSGIYGPRSIFGQMPDWNPAEMIGRAPRPLSVSLYRYLITDHAWRQARSQMGYAEPRGMPLMVSLGGQPFIDVRLSFHSLLPADLEPEIAEKLSDAWLDRLAAQPHLHDKIEFEVAITASSFDVEDRLSEHYAGLLAPNQAAWFKDALAGLTGRLLRGDVASMDGELAKIQRLDEQRELLTRQRPTDLASVAALLEDCISLGTIPFSILARHAFIAQDLLRSLVTRNVFTPQDATNLMSSVRTVAGELADDCRQLVADELPRDEFLRRYGHLRPGTYDILSPRYDQRDDLFSGTVRQSTMLEQPAFTATAEQLKGMDDLLKAHNLGLSSPALLTYIKEATAAREYAKFVFTRNVSDALEGIAAWGEAIGLSRDELSYMDIHDILDTLVEINEGDVERHLRPKAIAGRQRHETTKAVRLPQILVDPADVHVVPLRLSEPNFITHKGVRAHAVRLGGHDQVPDNMAGAIVLIENADPGFDWIFAYGIAGLVTRYGGANSHMAIRCAEFGIPAAIGCGEQIFDRLCSVGSIEIDCAAKHVQPADTLRG